MIHISSFIILIILILCSCKQEETTKKPKHLVVGCSIYDLKGKQIWHYANGGLCAFRENGDFIAHRGNQLIYMDHKMKQLWSKPFFVHHRIKVYEDEIVFLSSEEKMHKGELHRFDKLIAVDFKGNIKKEFSFFNHMDYLFAGRSWPLEPHLPGIKSSLEFSHANAVDRIPANRSFTWLKEFKEGNYLINTNLQDMIFIVSHDMQDLIWFRRHDEFLDYPSPGGHDAQVLPNGKILMFCNMNEEVGSRVELLDPVKMKATNLFRSNDQIKIYSQYNGSVQLLDEDNLLMISNLKNEHKVIQYDIRKEVVIFSIEFKGDRNLMTAYRVNLDEFLENNRGL